MRYYKKEFVDLYGRITAVFFASVCDGAVVADVTRIVRNGDRYTTLNCIVSFSKNDGSWKNIDGKVYAKAIAKVKEYNIKRCDADGILANLMSDNNT